MARINALVIGAGVIGLATARALAQRGCEVIVVDSEGAMGQHASSRNSEVLHAGLYYPPGSLKARLCVQGRHALLAYCRARGVAHAQPGKLVVATRHDQHAELQRIYARGQRNGVEDLRLLSAREARALEPTIAATSALLSPATGIVDSHGLMQALWRDAQDAGALMALRTHVRRMEPCTDGVHVWTDHEEPPLRFHVVVNAAGLGARAIAIATAGLDAQHVPPLHLLKGTYFSFGAPSPWSHLVYPVPDTASLGIHLTLDLHGRARFGPDQQWIDTIDYVPDPTRAAAFAAAIAAYYPALDATRLRPDYVGIRAKTQGPGEPPTDFMIQGPTHHGIAGLCNLFGIESPGLTSCLAIAEEVVRCLDLPASSS